MLIDPFDYIYAIDDGYYSLYIYVYTLLYDILGYWIFVCIYPVVPVFN